MEGIGKEGELVRTSEKKRRGQVKLARVSGGRRRREKRNFSLKRSAGSNQTTAGFELRNKQWP